MAFGCRLPVSYLASIVLTPLKSNWHMAASSHLFSSQVEMENLLLNKCGLHKFTGQYMLPRLHILSAILTGENSAVPLGYNSFKKN